MHMHFDALIVGSGPAGAAAARILALRGHNVALLEKARHPRPKLCGGLLTWKTRQVLERAFGLDLNALRKAGVVRYETHGYALHYLGRDVATGRSEEPFVLVDRPGLDALLAGLALDAGASLMQEARALTVTGAVDHSSPEQVVVATEPGLDLAGDYLLGCDGAASMVRRSLGPECNPPHWSGGMAKAVEFTLPRAEAPAGLRDLDHAQLHLGHLRAGYGWVFPHQDSLLIGQCALADPNKPFPQAMRAYLEGLGLDPEAVSLHGHPLPYGNFLSRPAQGRILLCGDAAGLVEPTLGEGIFYALLSGVYAGTAVARALEQGIGGEGGDGEGGDPAALYQAKLERNILPELRASNRLRWTMLTALDRIGTWPLKVFMRLPHARLGEMVHGLRSYGWTRRKTWEWE